MERRQFLHVALSAVVLPATLTLEKSREPVVGLPCEGCEAVFDDMPATLASRARIAPEGEPGAPLTLMGHVTDDAGVPQSGIIVYAYHTDHTGIYPPPAVPATPAARRHGRLRGWVRTDAQGQYVFDSVRPASYPSRDIPEHIHMHIIEPGSATYYIDDVMFRDDPKLTPEQVRRLTNGRGGDGVVTPQRHEGIWRVQRDIVLGQAIPGYASRSVG